MATINSWGNQVLASGGAITLDSVTGTIQISGDATNTTVTVATGAGVKTLTMGSTNSTSSTTIACGTGGIAVGTSANAHSSFFGGAFSTSDTTLQSGSGALAVTSTNGTLTINSGTGALGISTDNTATTVNVATGGAVKTATFGSTNGASVTTIQNGSGALAITSTNGTITMNSGTGTLAIANDATAQTVNIATGAGAKLVTLGTTNGASSLALKTGTADFSLASATGTIMSALDTGEIVYPLQPAFQAYLTGTDADQTGNGGVYTLGSVTALTEVFDQNGDFNTNGTFTAPVTGRYFLNVQYRIAGTTIATTISTSIITSNRTYGFNWGRGAANLDLGSNESILADMDNADTATTQVVVTGEAGNTDDVTGFSGSTSRTWFSGYLAC